MVVTSRNPIRTILNDLFLEFSQQSPFRLIGSTSFFIILIIFGVFLRYYEVDIMVILYIYLSSMILINWKKMFNFWRFSEVNFIKLVVFENCPSLAPYYLDSV